MRQLLFVYGTLLPGLAPASMRAICDRLTPVSRATVQGSLYDLGPYPAVVTGGANLVHGELLEIDGDDTWGSLDRYEGCPRPGEGDGLFRRICTVATLPSGESVDCWIYVYDRDLSRAGAKLVASGCWRTHRGLL